MSDSERGLHRAQGSFADFLATMRDKLEREGRSEEYCSNFWDNLRNVACDFAQFGDDLL